MTTYYCVTVADDTVGPEVMRMRISRSGNLVDAGEHNRWPAGAHSLGSDRGQWPTLHATAEEAEAERAALAASCRHDWRYTDDEAICSRCGQVEPQYDQPPAADRRQSGSGNPYYRRRLSVDELRWIAEGMREQANQ